MIPNIFAISEPLIDEQMKLHPGFSMETVSDGLMIPTSMVFINDDLLVIEKNSGKVIKIDPNGIFDNQIVLDLPVSFGDESGLLGITSHSDHVYLYFTESLSGKDDYSVENSREVVFRYTWENDKLTNPILIKEFPFDHGQDSHAGGAMTHDENSIYFVIGDQRQHGKYQNILENETNSKFVTGSIYKFNTEKNSIEQIAMGIRNSFGLAIDPLTGYLWATENGDNYYDEINLVTPKFNSGWKMVMGPSEKLNLDTCEFNHEVGENTCTDWLFDKTENPQKIPSFEDFRYSEPEFSWDDTVGVTAIEFPNEDGFSVYSDYMFVSDFNNSRLYKFKLNSDRTGFVFNHPGLNDLILEYSNAELAVLKKLATDVNVQLEDILFARNVPGGITDIEFHKGEMYVVSIFDGSIYKFFPNELLSQVDIGPKEFYHLFDTAETFQESFKMVKSEKFSLELYDAENIEDDVDYAYLKQEPIDILSVESKLHMFTIIPNSNVFHEFPDKTTSVWSFKNTHEFTTDNEIFEFMKEQERNYCSIKTMDENQMICNNLKYLGTSVVEIPNNQKAYVTISKSQNYYYHAYTSLDEDKLPKTFEKIKMITIMSWIFDDDNIWMITSNLTEQEFEWNYKGAIQSIKTFTLLEPKEEIVEISQKNSDFETDSEGGGCLIATAAFGSEMAPQVQLLRELRDNTVLQTQSGTLFMTGFNHFYYSFSPAIADYERENPFFKEAVKVTLTPLLTSLTLLNYVDVDTEEEIIVYGIGIILLNIGMYFVAPAAVIIAIKNRIIF